MNTEPSISLSWQKLQLLLPRKNHKVELCFNVMVACKSEAADKVARRISSQS